MTYPSIFPRTYPREGAPPSIHGYTFPPMWEEWRWDHIDLRKELHDIFYGAPGMSPKGHWVVLRHFDLARRSKYWNDEKKEAVGGPAWEYEDILVKTRRTTQNRSVLAIYAEQEHPFGVMQEPHHIYYFEWWIEPQLEDEIYELRYEGIEKPTGVTEETFRRRLDIVFVTEYRSDNGGRIEYFACVAKET